MAARSPERPFLDPQALARLASIPLHARRAMVGSVSGMHASPHRGASVEFAEYRRYIPGDDLRRLDWRAFGRTDRYYVKEFEADTNLRMCLVVDTSGSMGFGSGEMTKLQYAQRLAGSLAYLAVQQGDAVGLTKIAATTDQSLPARRTPSHLRSINDLLDSADASGETQLARGLHELAETTPTRALIVILSDLLLEADELRSAIDHLKFRKHDIAIFHLLDPQEVNFDYRRPTRFVDLESKTSLLADPAEIADRYHQALHDHLTRLRAIFLQSAIDYHRIVTDENDEAVLLKFLAGRARGRSVR